MTASDDLPPPTPSIDWLLLTSYLAGDVTVAERATVDAWLAADPIHQERLDRLAGAGVDRPGVFDVDEAWARATPDKRHPDVLVMQGQRRAHNSGVFVAAACFAVLATVAVSYVLVTHRSASQPFREFATTPGNRATVTLRDGTRLTLAPATRVRVPSDFGVAQRMVELDGEAYFSVVHDAQHPFAVQTGRTTVRDVGTEFDVRGYADEPTVRVAVAQGEVAVGGASLLAGDIATIADGHIAITRQADIEAATAWLQGQLVFRATPLAEVARRIGQKFDIEVTIADTTLAHQLVTATFTSETADQVLDEVTDIVGARFERHGHVVTIRRQAGHADRRNTTKPNLPDPLRTARLGPGSIDE